MYALTFENFTRGIAPGVLKRNMSDPVPAMILVRVAVDLEWQSKGIGKALIRDAMTRTYRAAKIARNRTGFALSPARPQSQPEGRIQENVHFSR